MFRIRLTLVQRGDRWEFRIGKGFRFVNGAAAVALLASGIVLGAWLVPGLLALVAAVGALYEESARFDRTVGRAEFRLGLLFWYRKRSFALSEVTEVRVNQFGPAQFVGLEVGLKDGRVFTIENDRGKASTGRLTAWGQDLARWLEVPLRA